jgi:flagellar biosynthesis GTPase FlhF
LNNRRSRIASENSAAYCDVQVAAYFPRVIFATGRCAILAIFFLLVYVLPTLAQPQKVFTLNDISDLIKNGVTPNRIAQLVEEHGVGFELDDRALRRLKQDGANETVLAAVKKMSARYTEERQRIRQQEEETKRMREEEARRREAEKRRADEQKRPQAKGTQEVARKTEEAKRKAQEEARQKSERPTLGSAEGVASVRNVMSTEQGEVSGELVNHTKQTLREVRLQILYSWRWKNEHHPGKDDPGRATYHVLDQEIPPGQTVRFNYRPSPPLASREDGQFDISVKVVGFAQVFPGGAQR